MKLWRLSQTQNPGYDTYDSAVVAARTEAEARNTHPRGPEGWKDGAFSEWARSPEAVNVEYIGTAKRGTKAGAVICASYNAG